MSGIKDNLSKAIQKSKDAVTGTPAVKIKIREATSNKNWGPTGQQLQELARCSFHYHSFGIIMAKIWKRLNDHGKNWRRIYKALLVLDYLIKNGSKQVVVDARAHLPNIQTLTTYQHIDSSDADVGQSVRERSRAIIELLNDPDRLAEEREKAKHNRGKYSDSMGSDGGRRATRSREDNGSFGDDTFESKGDDYSGKYNSPSYPKRSGVNSPRPRRTSESDDDEVPRPEPLPVEWISDSQEDRGISYNNSGESKSHRSTTRSNPKKASRTPSAAPPDLQDKVKQLKEMFPGLSSDAAVKTLRKSNYSISDAALRLSDPKRMSKYTGGGQQQGSQSQAVSQELTSGYGHNLSYSSGNQMTQHAIFQPQQTQPLQYPSIQPQLQQPGSFVAQPGHFSAIQPGQQGFYGGQQTPQQPLSGPITSPIISPMPGAQQNWTTFGAGSGVTTLGSASSALGSQPGSAIPSVTQQPLVASMPMMQQTQQLPTGSFPAQQTAFSVQPARQPPLSGGAPAIAPFPATLQYPVQGTMPPSFAASASYGASTGAPNVSVLSAAPFGATPGSPLQQPFGSAHQQAFTSPVSSPQLPHHSLAGYQQQTVQGWPQATSSGFVSTPFGQTGIAQQQSSGMYGSSTFLASPPGSQSRPGQQAAQHQNNADAAFAALVAQQLPKGAQLGSVTGTAQAPEPKKTLAQMQQASPFAPQGAGQNPFGGPPQQQNLFF